MGLLEDLIHAGVEDVDQCNACQSDQHVPDVRFAKFLHLPFPFGVRRCCRCKLRWLSPRPSHAGFQTLYSSRYYFEPEDLPAYESIVDLRIEAFRHRIHALIEKNGVSSILDFGAATGRFVAVAREAGLHAEGVEFSADARQQAHDQHSIRLYSPEELWRLTDRFDAIHMNHVLEHMPNPLAHLRWCHSKLNTKGILFIEVPQQFDNDADRLRRIFHKGGLKEDFDAFSVHHTYFFSPSNLAILARKAGFSVQRLATSFPKLTHPAGFRRRLLQRVLDSTNFLHRGGDTIELLAHKRG